MSVVPREGCELLEIDQGAYTNVVTLAASELEYRAKLYAAMDHYLLEVQSIENVARAADWVLSAEELVSIVDELENSGNEKHVRFCTLHTFPRVK